MPGTNQEFSPLILPQFLVSCSISRSPHPSVSISLIVIQALYNVLQSKSKTTIITLHLRVSLKISPLSFYPNVWEKKGQGEWGRAVLLIFIAIFMHPYD